MRLGKLYSIKDFDEESAVYLAEWIYDNYKYENIDTVIDVLSNPPKTKDERGNTVTNWKLTPDTIQRWMEQRLELEAASRESEHQKLKESFNEPLPNVDYDSFRKRLEEGTALKEIKSDPWLKGDDAYSKFKANRMKNEISKNNNQNEEKGTYAAE